MWKDHGICVVANAVPLTQLHIPSQYHHTLLVACQLLLPTAIQNSPRLSMAICYNCTDNMAFLITWSSTFIG